MKKFSNLFAAMFLVTMVAMFVSSCSKDLGSKDQPIAKTYASAISGQFIPQDGDITLKTAPLIGGHQINCYVKKVDQTNWSVVDGTEFLPGSLPAVDWHGYQIDAQSWWFSGGVYITYCPILPMKVVIKATEYGFGTTPSYLGIWEGTPSAASFPINIIDRRLGDVLKLNTDALTALPGYTNMSFDVVYTESVIDVNGTALASGATTNGWPTYSYSSNPEKTFHLDATKSAGLRTVYDGLTAKITGTITINIHVDSNILTVSTPAAGLGKGLAITLSTKKVGWYDSGTIGVTPIDIDVETVNIEVK